MTDVKPGVRPAHPALFRPALRQAPGLEPASPHRRRSRALAPIESRQGEAQGSAIDLTREVLEVPADYRIGIVPASDTGAMELAIWSLLGARGP